LFGLAQPLLDQFDVPARCLSSALRLLLESVEDKNSPCVFQGVHRPKSVTTVVLDDFQNACSPKPLKTFAS
jgi:hypothetical protein